MGKFIGRLRAQHEDETNYKFVLQNLDRSIEKGIDKYLISSKATVKSVLNTIFLLADSMIKKIL